ncbi:MAG: Gfo/Idh/MocA family oxidoreductase [Parcubacteria group bacterium]|nr:Gfo/Idh/MocA family oxidoreductase [Parcubacteria group bacterium]
MNTNKKLNVALIGAGGIGSRWAKAIAGNKKCILSVICDVDYAKAEILAGRFRGCRAESSWERVARAKDIDAAVVALPHNLLAPVSIAFLKNKKHVLCEKPGGISPAEVEKAIALAKKNRVRYMICFNHRYHDGFVRARKLFEGGAIGEILFIRARYGFGGRKGYEKEWRFNKKISGGGELIDQGVHMIDLVRWFLGDIAEVRGFTEDTFWKGGVEDNAFLILKNKKRQMASIHVSWTQWDPMHSFEIYGTKGYLVIDGLGKKYGGGERLHIGKRSKNFGADEKVIVCDNNADRSLLLSFREFVSAIREEREPVPSGYNGLETLRIAHSIYDEKKR